MANQRNLGGGGVVRIALTDIMQNRLEEPVRQGSAYAIRLGSFEEFYGVLLDPGGDGRPFSVRNAVNFADVLASEPGVSVSLEYDRGPETEETMSEWMLNKALGLLDACEALGTGDHGGASEINSEVAGIERARRDLSAVGRLLCDCDKLAETLFADDVHGLLELAMSTSERVRLSLALFGARKSELGLAHKSVSLLLSRGFHAAVVSRCGDRLKPVHRDRLVKGFQRSLAKNAGAVAMARFAIITARPSSRSASAEAPSAGGPRTQGTSSQNVGAEAMSAEASTPQRPIPCPPVTRWGALSEFARLLDVSEVTEDFLKSTCENLSEASRLVLRDTVARVFREVLS